MARRNSKFPINANSTVGENFKDNEELICDLTSFDVWIKLNILIESNVKKTLVNLYIRVERSLDTEAFRKVIQKLVITFWNVVVENETNHYFVLKEIKIVKRNSPAAKPSAGHANSKITIKPMEEVFEGI